MSHPWLPTDCKTHHHQQCSLNLKLHFAVTALSSFACTYIQANIQRGDKCGRLAGRHGLCGVRRETMKVFQMYRIATVLCSTHAKYHVAPKTPSKIEVSPLVRETWAVSTCWKPFGGTTTEFVVMCFCCPSKKNAITEGRPFQSLQ